MDDDTLNNFDGETLLEDVNMNAVIPDMLRDAFSESTLEAMLQRCKWYQNRAATVLNVPPGATLDLVRQLHMEMVQVVGVLYINGVRDADAGRS
jgi:hypothetical protein